MPAGRPPEPTVATDGPHEAVDDASELAWLRRAEALGVPVTPMALVPAQVEADFYRWNNLPERIAALLADLDPRDPDEDDVEELLPTAAAWVRDHALLDAVVDTFYDALSGLPPRVTVRRPGAPGVVAGRGRPALIAVKRAWAEDWLLAPSVARAREGRGWLPAPRPVLVHAADLRADPAVAAAAENALGRPVAAWSDGEGRLARLGLG
ncbi:MAG: hypothetical protein ACNA8N_03320 [Trueperaceae bacterium]